MVHELKAFCFQIIDKDFLTKNLSLFMDILKNEPHEYWGESHFSLDLPDKWKHSIAILIDEILIGYIIASRKGSSIHIHKFMISKDYRGINYGTLLLNYFEKHISLESKEITLKVYKDNIKAINFYNKNGFKKVSTSEELILLKKELS